MRLIVFSGPSGSGKSTTIRNEFNSAVLNVVSYDEIREDLEQYRSDIPPSLITEYVFRDAGYRLMQKQSVVVDAINLHPHDRLRWEAVAWAFDVELEWRSMDTPLEVCVERDALRDDPVGREAIEQQLQER